jgi:Flp pilus assembly protein TadB
MEMTTTHSILLVLGSLALLYGAWARYKHERKPEVRAARAKRDAQVEAFYAPLREALATMGWVLLTVTLFLVFVVLLFVDPWAALVMLLVAMCSTMSPPCDNRRP